MKKKRNITFYDNLNGPYLDALSQGLVDTPEEKYVKFFEECQTYH